MIGYTESCTRYPFASPNLVVIRILAVRLLSSNNLQVLSLVTLHKFLLVFFLRLFVISY